eukprot:TRINITY_DN11038_c0_g1_i7.p1 TRINITY_DN11038_c0_g1~~TRINITY_DN11038_c0_g1_i7.p1  ORF type:complete len:203 (+),score=36.83 TRINITY_DN11038_c0_g1_i7:186-794(+)
MFIAKKACDNIFTPKTKMSEAQGLSQAGLKLDAEEIKHSPTKRKYIPVGYDTRKQLLTIINEENLTIKAAAKRLGVNYSNAKSIFKVYKNEYRIAKLPKKPNLSLKDVTLPYSRSSVCLKAALLPFYDAKEAQFFLNWSKDSGKRKREKEETEQESKENPIQSAEPEVDPVATSSMGSLNYSIFDFCAYRLEISYRFSLMLN